MQFGPSGVTEQQNRVDAIVGAGASIIAHDLLVKNTEAVDAYSAFDNSKVGVFQCAALIEGFAERKSGGSVQH